MVELIQILIGLGFHAFDFITGFIGALRQKKIKSSKMRDGMFKKVGFIGCYILAIMIDKIGGLIGLSVGVKVLPIIVLYAVLTEIVSITENLHKINPDLVPDKILGLLHIDVKGDEWLWVKKFT